MPYRSDLPKCPTCGRSAVIYDVLWDYLRCPEDHFWDGPLNDKRLEGCSLPGSGNRMERPGYKGHEQVHNLPGVRRGHPSPRGVHQPHVEPRAL